MSRSLGLMVTTLGAAALLVGCGGADSDSQSTSEPTMTSSQTTTSFSSSATSTTSSVQPSEEISLSTEPAVQPEVSPAQVTEETVRQQAGFLAPAPAAAFYANCAAVRAAGAAPIYAGDPGYSFDLDHDGDGVACEK